MGAPGSQGQGQSQGAQQQGQMGGGSVGGSAPVDMGVVGQLVMGGMSYSDAMLHGIEISNQRYASQVAAQRQYMENLKELYGRQTNPETGETYTLADDLAARGIMPGQSQQGQPTQGQPQGQGAPQGQQQAQTLGQANGMASNQGGAQPAVVGGGASQLNGMASIPPDSPLMGMTPKQIVAQKGEDFKTIDQASKDAQAAAGPLRILNGLQQAYSQINTGVGTTAEASLNKLLGTNFGGANPAVIENIASKGVDLFANAVKGLPNARMSEPIINFLQTNAPSPNNEKAANDAIFDTLKQKLTDPIQQSQAMQAYYKTYGTTVGFGDKWAQYSSSPQDYNNGNWGKYVTRQAPQDQGNQGGQGMPTAAPQGNAMMSNNMNATPTQANSSSNAMPISTNNSIGNQPMMLQALMAEKMRRQRKK